MKKENFNPWRVIGSDFCGRNCSGSENDLW